MNALTFHALTGLLLFLSLDFQSLFLTSSSSFSSKVHASELEASSAASVGKQRRGEPQYREKWNDDFTVDWQGGKYDLPLGYIPAGSQRPPGTLLLNMLIKNEREHLDRTLPQWAKVIDYWIIGVDDANTDGSEDVIQKHLGHIPGHIVIVNFDGMGPTWSILVNEGIIHYPEATHGIMSDADFMPLKPESFDKYQLDIRCSKHMYVIWTEDHSSERKMDWIYRNIPGVIIKRRTHQTIEAPPLRGQTVFQTLVDLPIEERAGGYQDRSGKKSQKYIEWLEKDLVQYPGDTRTLYYLAYAHLEIFLPNRNDPQPEHWEHLQIAVDYLTERIGIEAGNVEEKWFTYLKLGEIYDRFYKKWDVAKKYYIGCTEDDPERADPFFYIGQHYRLRSDHKEAIKWLAPAARKSMPARSLFQWHSLYHCLAAVEYARALKIAAERKDIQMEEVNEIVELLAKADCSRESGSERNDIGTLRSFFAKQYARMTGGAAFEKLEIIRRLDTITAQHYDTLDRSLDAISLIDLSVDKNFDIVVTEDEEWNKDADTSHSLWSLMEEKLSPALQYLEDLEELKEKNVGKDLVNPPPKRTKREKSRRKSKKKGKKAGSDEDADLIAWHKKNSCRSFRRATKEYTRFFSKYQDVLAAKITPDSVYQKLATITTQIIDLCR